MYRNIVQKYDDDFVSERANAIFETKSLDALGNVFFTT